MDVAWVGALHVGDRLRVAEAGQGVHVPVGVVAFDVTVLEDKEAFGAECFFDEGGDLVFA